MKSKRVISPITIAVLVGIGCGGGKPQDASATTEQRETHSETPIRLAQAPAEAQSTTASSSASIRGMVRFSGTAPSQERIKMDADPVCKQQHPEPRYAEEVAANSNGTLKNVFVYVKEGATGPFTAPTAPVTLDQRGCWYQPHIFGIQVNQPLEIVNNDPSLHNVNVKPANNPPFNIAQPVKGMKTTKKFTKPEVMVKFKCNVHPWMSAYAGVLEHPFFSVSDGEGAFTLKGLPAGTYTIDAWHEKYGTQTQQVTVADGESKSVDITFAAQ